MAETHLIPRKKYVAAILDGSSQKSMSKYCIKNGFDLSFTFGGEVTNDFEFHVTLMYSETEHMTPQNTVKAIVVPLELTPVDFELLGEDKDIPVLRVRQSPLIYFRKHFIETYDMKDKWDEWKPHISLSYLRKKYDLTKIPLPDFPIKVDRIKIEDVIE